MAGTYPDVPGRRMAWDRDGTILLHVTPASSSNEQSQSIRQALNDETDSSSWSVSGGAGTHRVVLIFPQLRNILAYYITAIPDWGQVGSVQSSTNTTNGVDGTWTQVLSSWAMTTFTHTGYRDNIKSITASDIKAIRFNASHGSSANRILHTWRALHLYGDISAGETPDRLRVWHPTLDEEVDGAYFDWGDAPRESTATRDFRIKNNSSTQTANDITVTREALTPGSPSIVTQHDLSDGGAFASSLNIGNLGPGATSGVLTLRRSLLDNAALSLWSLRIVASAASWS